MRSWLNSQVLPNICSRKLQCGVRNFKDERIFLIKSGKDLTQHGYDVFIDYGGIASGDFEAVILENIRARAHFLVVLTPTALERCSDPEDWMAGLLAALSIMTQFISMSGQINFRVGRSPLLTAAGSPGFEFSRQFMVWERQIYPIVKNVVLSSD